MDAKVGAISSDEVAVSIFFKKLDILAAHRRADERADLAYQRIFAFGIKCVQALKNAAQIWIACQAVSQGLLMMTIGVELTNEIHLDVGADGEGIFSRATQDGADAALDSSHGFCQRSSFIFGRPVKLLRSKRLQRGNAGHVQLLYTLLRRSILHSSLAAALRRCSMQGGKPLALLADRYMISRRYGGFSRLAHIFLLLLRCGNR